MLNEYSGMTSILLPVRSNGAWFSNAEARSRLERQIKVNLLLYDKLLVQDGIYHVTAGVDGQGMSMFMPGDDVPTDRRKTEYFQAGSPFGVEVGGKQVMRSVSEFSYVVDYYPILHEAGLVDAEYIEWVYGDLAEPYKSNAKRQADADWDAADSSGVLPQNHYIKKEVLQGIYIDGLLANLLRQPFSVDYHAAPVIEWKQKKAMAFWKDELPPMFFDCWLYFDLPDFSNRSWNEVCKIRESAAGRDFRSLVARVAGRIETARAELADPREVSESLKREFTREIIEELLARRTTPTDALINLGLNLVPFGLVPSTLKDVSTLCKEGASWVSLMNRK